MRLKMGDSDTTRREKLKTEQLDVPDAQGHFGRFGGRFVAETLISALDDLSEDYEKAAKIRDEINKRSSEES